MKKIEMFEKGEKVRIPRINNDSGSNIYWGLPVMGVYNDQLWPTYTYEIEGTVKLHSFKSHDVYCSYLLSLNGKNVGFVYDNVLEKVEDDYQVGDWVVVKNYDQCDEGNGVTTKNLITKLWDINDTEGKGWVSGMGKYESSFIVHDPFSENRWSDTDKGYRYIKKGHIIRMASGQEINIAESTLIIQNKLVEYQGNEVIIGEHVFGLDELVSLLNMEANAGSITFSNGLTLTKEEIKKIVYHPNRQ
ncbi:MAG: hypothetical protein ACOC2U_00745 [bacterium]